MSVDRWANKPEHSARLYTDRSEHVGRNVVASQQQFCQCFIMVQCRKQCSTANQSNTVPPQVCSTTVHNVM